MKAQLSIEFMLLLAIAIAALAVTFSSFDSLLNSSSISTSRAFFLRESSFFYELTVDICITGDGNRRRVSFPYPFEVSYDRTNSMVFLNSSYGNMSYHLLCEVEEKIVSGDVFLINKKGKIFIEKP